MGARGGAETWAIAVAGAMKQREAEPQLTVARLHDALAGDAAAVAQLIDAVTPVVQARVARALLRRVRRDRRDVRQEVADLTQEVFVALFSEDAKALRAWEPARGLSLVNFVGLLAERRVASLLRVKRYAFWLQECAASAPEERAEDLAAEPVDSEVISRLTVEQLVEALRSMLSPRGLELFQRLYVDEQSVEDVCAQTGLNPAAVYQWKHRIAQTARTALAALQGDGLAGAHADRSARRDPHGSVRDEDVS